MKLITHHVSLLTLLLTSHFSLLTCHAAVPLRWTVETSRLQPAVFDVVRGETLELEATFKSYGMPVETSNMTAFVCWQTNGMGSAWWVTNAVTTATVARALFTPAMDPGTPTVTAFMGLSSATNSSLLTSHSSLNYRAAFTLRYRHGPGATPNALDTPPRVLDLANTVVVNPPWPTKADFAATTTVMRAELKDYVDDQIEGAGLVTPTLTTNIAGRVASNVVTKAYVEGLGIESGLDTNAVRVIVAEATNAVPRIVSGGHEIAANGETLIESPLGEWTPSHSQIPENPIDGDEYYYDISFDIHDDEEQIGTWLCGIRRYFEGEWHDYDSVSFSDDDASGNITAFTFPDGTPTRRLLRTRLATTNDVSTSSEQTLASAKTYADATTNGLATASTVSSLASQVSAIGAHLNAEDAHFVSTNYDSAVRLPEAYVEIKMNGTWITIWREMTRWTSFVGDAFTWDGWGGLHTWMTNVTAELSYKADRCWGIYDSETGGLSPEGCTQISSSNILVAANMAFQKTVTSGGAVWVLQCNSGVAHVSGDTNGFFRISDIEGATQFEIVRGDKQELGADADGITVDNSTSPPTVTIPYSVEADEHPTLQVCDDLISAQWKAETDAGCVANVTWTGSSGAYVATVRRKTAGDKLFVKATYMSGGETYIRNVAPVGMDAIILNGTKFYLGTNVISGKLVLTLSTTPQNQ